MHKVIISVIFLLFANGANAQDFMGEYLAWLGPNDIRNSSGVKMKSLGDVVAQDRANFHRFGVIDELDTGDPYFSQRSLRTRIPQLVKAGRSVEKYIINDVLSGRGHYVYIRLYGINGRITRMDVHEGAG